MTSPIAGPVASLWLLLTATAFAAETSTPAAPAPAVASPILIHSGQKVAFLGDSITAQGWGEPGGYVKLVVNGLVTEGVTITPIPAGISGHTSREMLARVDRDVLSKSPDWMTLSCGVNDVWHGASGVDLETYKKNITSIVDQAQAKGIKVIIMTSTCIYEEDNANNQKLAAYNEFLRGLAKERKLPLADEAAAYAEALKATPPPPGTKLLTKDGVHPNPNGHMHMARTILAAAGVPAADFPKIEAAWAAIPGGATLLSSLGKPIVGSITLGDYLALQKKAAAEGTTVSGLTDQALVKTCAEVFTAHAGDAQASMEKIHDEIEAGYAANLKALTGPAAPAAPKK